MLDERDAVLDGAVALDVLVDDFDDVEDLSDVEELLDPDLDGVLLLTPEGETEEVLLNVIWLDGILLDDFVLDEIFAEIVVLLDDSLLEVLLATNLLGEDDLPEKTLLEDDLIVEVLLEEVLETGLLLDLTDRVDEVFATGFFEDEDDLEFDFLVEVETTFVLDFFSDVVGLCKTHLQACLTAGTFKLGIGESCLSLWQAVSITILDCRIQDSQRVKEGTK